MRKIVIDISDKAYAHTQNLGCIWHQDNKEVANAINDVAMSLPTLFSISSLAISPLLS